MHTFVDYTKKYLKSYILLDNQNSIRIPMDIWKWSESQIQTWPELNKCVMSSNIMKIGNKW